MKKVFCIGLHKTGTSSLHDFALQCGYKSTHTVHWMKNENMLEEFDFFSDGGSHFDDQNEFNYEELLRRYPDALFILNTRDARSWVVSKLKHAGWTKDTVIEPDENFTPYSDWKDKSFFNIRAFLEHKFNYEAKVTNYFQKNHPDKILFIDVTKNKEQNVKDLIKFLGVNLDKTIEFPHSNKARKKENLSEEVMDFIDKVLLELESR